MKKLLKIEKRYLNIPINSQEKETGITICNSEDGTILRYFSAAVSFGNYEFISFYDSRVFKNWIMYPENELTKHAYESQ